MPANPFDPPADLRPAPPSSSQGQFATRFGTCTADADGLALVNNAPRGRISALVSGHSIWGLRAVYALGLAGASVSSAASFFQGASFDPVAAGLAVFMGYALIATRGHTRDMAISRGSIDHLQGRRGRRYLTVPRFVVHYQREGVPKKRMIQLSGSLLSPPDAYDHALGVLTSAGFEVR
jgi:hypothetical protein